jgi:hypothetical protein
MTNCLSIPFQAKQRFPRIAAEQRGPCRKRPLDTVDPDPYIHWTELKMGRTHTPRPGNFSSEASGSGDDDVTILEVFYFFSSSYVSLLQMPPQPAPTHQLWSAQCRFRTRLVMSSWRDSSPRTGKKKAPASEASPSEAPPAKRPRQEVVGGKPVTKKQYKKRQMPVASG